ncbi:MAG: uroporphyrinogen-III C-methyltransferase [Deltaproteobacteria bacterium]|nr:uroporphyrinogen-III C-methyltransferase [Deltaproteobacteria bacterium]
MNKRRGIVYLVGAGPGDPGLITLKGRQCIQRADVVVYDYLAAESLLRHAKSDAELIYVGKKGGDHTLSQSRINALLVEKASQGLVVTRLKGGDPFIFGRGGEEVEVLIEAGISFEVVPGVTSAVAAPAYAGIPLTHRKFTSTVAFVTGHEDPGKASSGIDWKALASGIGTLVFFMGVKNLKYIVNQLMRHGLTPERPAALIGWGTTPRQTTVTGTLGTIEKEAGKAGMKPPALIVIGDVVRLRERMKWFEKRPLLGRRIVVTRARKQASGFLQMLTDAGADCLECPTIKVVPPESWQALDRAVDRIAGYDWLVFTSVNGVTFFFERIFNAGLDSRSLQGIQVAAIGPATAERLMDYGIRCDIIPENYRAESMAAAFEKVAIADKSVLLPRAREARSVLPEALTRMGARVDEVIAYVTEVEDRNGGTLIDNLEKGNVDCITFTSSSTVKNFKRLLPADKFPALVGKTTIACIGPITAATAEALGFDVHIVAREYTIPGLYGAIVDHYKPS